MLQGVLLKQWWPSENPQAKMFQENNHTKGTKLVAKHSFVSFHYRSHQKQVRNGERQLLPPKYMLSPKKSRCMESCIFAWLKQRIPEENVFLLLFVKQPVDSKWEFSEGHEIFHLPCISLEKQRLGTTCATGLSFYYFKHNFSNGKWLLSPTKRTGTKFVCLNWTVIISTLY